MCDKSSPCGKKYCDKCTKKKKCLEYTGCIIYDGDDLECVNDEEFTAPTGSKLNLMLSMLWAKICSIVGSITTIQGDITTIQGDITTIENNVTTIVNEGNLSVTDNTTAVAQTNALVFEGATVTESNPNESTIVVNDQFKVVSYLTDSSTSFASTAVDIITAGGFTITENGVYRMLYCADSDVPSGSTVYVNLKKNASTASTFSAKLYVNNNAETISHPICIFATNITCIVGDILQVEASSSSGTGVLRNNQLEIVKIG
jgi:hypothetical protein